MINNFINEVDLVTYEFENIPYETLNEINKLKPVLPKPAVNRIIQHRLAEKDFINKGNPITYPYLYHLNYNKEINKKLIETGLIKIFSKIQQIDLYR